MDRFLSVNLVAPLRRLVSDPGSSRCVPILMYHAITDDPEPGVRGYYRLNTPPALFREHLRLLKAEGYQVINLADAVELMAGRPLAGLRTSQQEPQTGNAKRATGPAQPETRNPKPESRSRLRTPRYAVITFDDGFLDFAEHAAPALREVDFSATVFLPTAFIGCDRRSFKDRPCLNWGEVRRLRDEGFFFGSHTVNHPKLWELDAAGLMRELVDSRRQLEDELGDTVDTFAHPYAFPATDSGYVRRFTEAAGAAGYRVGVTTALGRARPGDHPLRLKRLPVNGADDPRLFRAKLHGAYDWLAAPQTLVKRLKRRRGS